jgi:hypothetical protein
MLQTDGGKGEVRGADSEGTAQLGLESLAYLSVLGRVTELAELSTSMARVTIVPTS